MESSEAELLNEVAHYYSDKLAEHGATARGVDWQGESSQLLRFEQLIRIVSDDSAFSANDLGCGYGAMLEFLVDRRQLTSYLGIDVSKDMVDAARRRHRGKENAEFVVSDYPCRIADYGFASGIFNVRLHYGDEEWLRYLKLTLDRMNETSESGFAFNCLTSYSDEDKRRDDLHYADPCELFDFCKRRYSPHVALLHDYGLYEFTILVRKIA